MEETQRSPDPGVNPLTLESDPKQQISPITKKQQASVYAMEQSPAEDISSPIVSHKTKKILKYALISIAAIPVIVIGGYIIVFVLYGYIKMSKLQNAANNKLEKLEQMLSIDSKVTDARGIVDGDVLTAYNDPAQSSSAYLIFENKSYLREIETKLAEAMAKEGFKRDGGDRAPYYKTTSPAYSGNRLDNINRIEMRYSNNQDAIKITYELDKYYACPKDYMCERTEKSKPSEKIYDIRWYASVPVVKVSVRYADKNYYLTRL
ncbi:hypothetical protein IPL85_01575 [Candidatus Saccharibacteria bacterium]|nr:MAG: hypothetical protein IPL85_01575 [Candidatus Saccharibacteria bacterium]